MRTGLDPGLGMARRSPEALGGRGERGLGRVRVWGVWVSTKVPEGLDKLRNGMMKREGERGREI